jgi:CheY-like chemotaxis protein
MDEIMPIMKGSEAISIIRRLGYTRPIISVTGNVLEEDQQFIVDSGATQVVGKPLKLQDIEQILIRNK